MKSTEDEVNKDSGDKKSLRMASFTFPSEDRSQKLMLESMLCVQVWQLSIDTMALIALFYPGEAVFTEQTSRSIEIDEVEGTVQFLPGLAHRQISATRY